MSPYVLFVPFVANLFLVLIRHSAHAGLGSAAAPAAGALTHRGFHTVAAAGDGEYGQLFLDVLAVAVTAVGLRIVPGNDLFKWPAAVAAEIFK
jgi:hypothetical protein